MLHLNMLINGFTVMSIVSLFRAGRQDGAVILAQHADTREIVVAEVPQSQINLEGPAQFWDSGEFFAWGPEDTDLHSVAAVKAGASLAERTGIAAVAATAQAWKVDADAKVAAQAALAKVRADVEGKTYKLIHTEYNDSLTPKQLNVLLSGENEFDYDEFANLEEAESDQRYGNAINEIRNILDEDEFDALDADPDLLDEARFLIEEHDTSSMVQSLLESTGSLLVRYDLGVSVSTDYTSSDDDRREQAIEILAALHVDATVFNVESLIAAIVDILVEVSGGGQAFMMWYADPAELVKAARPFQQARFEGVGTAPAATISFKDTHLLVLNTFEGSGYSDVLPGTFTTEFDATRLVSDEGDDGLSWSSIAGLVQSAFATDVTITALNPTES